MKNINAVFYRNISLFIALLALPCAAFAFGFDTWKNPAGDKSIYYLGMIFGNVSTALPGAGGNNIVGNLFNIFNIAVLTLGSLVVSYTIVLSAINTAQEGEVMGKKWSSMWIPMRSALGVAFLLPTASGYSLLQIMMMNIIVLGIAAANQLWQHIVNAALIDMNSTGVFGEIKFNESALSSVSRTMLGSLTCVQVYNTNPACQDTALASPKVFSAYTEGDSLFFGVQGDPELGDWCGSATASRGTPRQAFNRNSWVDANLSALAYTAAFLAGPVAEAVPAPSTDPTISNAVASPSFIDIIPGATNMLQGALSTAPRKEANQTSQNQKAAKSAISQGWIFAGSYYFMIISNNRTINWSSLAFSPTAEYSKPSGISSECSNALNQANRKLMRYLRATELYQPISDDDFAGEISDAAGTGKKNPTGKMVQGMNEGVNDLSRAIIKSLTKRDKDPVKSLADVGSDLIAAAEGMWMTMIGIAFAVIIIACIMAGYQPVCWAGTAALSFLIPIVMAIIGLLWGAGVALGIYTPLIPYLVFTFTAMGWLLLVIEAMAAAPIVALGLVSPSQEHMGRASGSVLIITNIFLRPSLMVLGFIAAAKLVRPAVEMINYGFLATVNASVGGLGLFGTIALIMLYAGIITSVISEAFSLIHVLPDKIIRWIGGQAEQSSVKEKMGEAKKASEEGGQAGAGAMKGSLGYAGKKGKEQQKKMEDMEKKSNTSNKGGGSFITKT